MLETYFSAQKMLGHLRSGPGGPYLDGFTALLKRDGYSPATAIRYLRAAAHLGHFVHEQGGTLTDIDLPAFSEHLRACRCPRSKGGRRNHHTVYGAQHFRGFLLAIGVCVPAIATQEVQYAEPEVIARFRTWLRKHHGAADPTIRLYTRDAASLVTALGDDPGHWDATGIRNAFMERAGQSGKSTVEKLITSLRAFLRYLAVQGLCRADLDKGVPAYARWRLAELPRYLTAQQVDSLITACDGDAPGRRRDRAILLLLARLGLRAGDVAQLRLADIEWETGSLRSAGNRAIRFVFRSRKRSGTRSSPISNAGLRPVGAITSSFVTSPPTRAPASPARSATHICGARLAGQPARPKPGRRAYGGPGDVYGSRQHLLDLLWYLEATADLMRGVAAAGEAFLSGEAQS